MLITKGLIAAAALAQTTTAFFPWFPDYRCVEDHRCIASKRAKEAEVEARGMKRSVKIEQRLPKNDLPHDTQVRKLAERLRQKYNRGTPVFPEAVQGRDVDKRDNKYKVMTAADPTQTNSAGIHQDGTDFSYFATVKLGSKETPIYMLLDTGAGTSWVMGPSCTSKPCTTHNTFGPDDSTTFKSTGNTFQIQYGSGEVSGVMATDSLSLAGLIIPATFGIANKTSDDFNSFPIDGILGLSQAKGDNPTFMETLVESKTLKSNIFGVSLNRATDGPNTGAINFGAVDDSQFIGDVAYSPVNENTEGDWAIQMDEISFGDKTAGIDDKLAYIDTGTSYIFAPDGDVKKFHDIVPGAVTKDGVTYTVPCTTTTDLTFTFGKNSYKVSAKDWVGPMAAGTCTSNIYGHVVVEGAWLLGDTFLKNVYSVFDIDENRVGFAAKDATTAASSSSSFSTSATGGPTSLTSQLPSPTPPSSGTTSTTTGSTSIKGESNGVPTESSTSPAPTQTSTTSADANASESSSPAPMGLNGHQTSAQSATAAAESSTNPSSTLTGQSGASRLDSSLLSAVFALAGFVHLVT